MLLKTSVGRINNYPKISLYQYARLSRNQFANSSRSNTESCCNAIPYRRNSASNSRNPSSSTAIEFNDICKVFPLPSYPSKNGNLSNHPKNALSSPCEKKRTLGASRLIISRDVFMDVVAPPDKYLYNRHRVFPHPNGGLRVHFLQDQWEPTHRL